MGEKVERIRGGDFLEKPLFDGKQDGGEKGS